MGHLAHTACHAGEVALACFDIEWGLGGASAHELGDLAHTAFHIPSVAACSACAFVAGAACSACAFVAWASCTAAGEQNFVLHNHVSL